jgi:hypothetical protein
MIFHRRYSVKGAEDNFANIQRIFSLAAQSISPSKILEESAIRLICRRSGGGYSPQQSQQTTGAQSSQPEIGIAAGGHID